MTERTKTNATRQESAEDAELRKARELAAKVPWEDRPIKYRPLGEHDDITLSPGMVKLYLAAKTKKGFEATEKDITQFLMLCKARLLNPWVGDAYLVGYDSERDGPQFSLITSYQALAKRADGNPNYDGIESGVIVKRGEEVLDIPGSCVDDNDRLMGGWARVYRKDRSKPFVARIPIASFDKKRSLWTTHRSHMIEKCAKAAAQREAFPNECSGLYTRDEMDHRTRDDDEDSVPNVTNGVTDLGTLGDQLATRIPDGSETKAKSSKSAKTAEKPEPTQIPDDAPREASKPAVPPDWQRRVATCVNVEMLNKLELELLNVANGDSDLADDIMFTVDRTRQAMLDEQS